ncbi:hypothetical protein LP7551_02781 [Roseibium album]|nr:hypothetical protein LP7551_02781 [Roseibium album]
MKIILAIVTLYSAGGLIARQQRNLSSASAVSSIAVKAEGFVATRSFHEESFFVSGIFTPNEASGLIPKSENCWQIVVTAQFEAEKATVVWV